MSADSTRPRFAQVLEEMLAIHEAKDADYAGNRGEYANFRTSEGFGIPAWVGAMVRANDKMERIKTFVSSGNLMNESVEDSLLDLANYAVIALILYREGEPEPLPAAPEPSNSAFTTL